MKTKKIKEVVPKVRPKEPNWDFSGIEAVVRLWAQG